MTRKVDLDALYVIEGLELTLGGNTYTVASLSAGQILGLQEAVEKRTEAGAIEALFGILGALGVQREELLTWDFRVMLAAARVLIEHFTSVQQVAAQTGQSAEVAEVDASIVN